MRGQEHTQADDLTTKPDHSGPGNTVPGRIDRWTKRAMPRAGWHPVGAGKRVRRT
jgi:hypothetical protein